MGKLHEVLAVEKDLQAEWHKALIVAKETLERKDEYFVGYSQTTKMIEEGAHDPPGVTREMSTTVKETLDLIRAPLQRYLDAWAQKETTNQHARATVEIDAGSKFMSDAPATLLLGLEDKLTELRKVLQRIPTLPPGVRWEKDESLGTDVYRAKHPEKKLKTAKRPQSKVLVPSTDRHPAQVETWNEDIPVGEVTTERWTGMISPADKQAMIERLDVLVRAVRRARTRANTQEVNEYNIGKIVWDFIFNPKT
jgi:hypothetical protein